MLDDVFGKLSELAKKHTLSTIMGLLVGFFLVWYLKPDTAAGTVLILFISSTLFFCTGALYSRLRR